MYDLSFEMVNLEPKEQILEIGFGNGIHFPQYFEFNTEVSVTGIDFSEDMCNEARILNTDLIDSGKLSFRCADTSSLPFPDESFDLVIAIM